MRINSHRVKSIKFNSLKEVAIRNVVYILACLSLVLSGCGGGGVDKTSMGEVGKELPDWVLNPGRIDSDKDIIGVGVVSGVKNEALAMKPDEKPGNRELSQSIPHQG